MSVEDLPVVQQELEKFRAPFRKEWNVGTAKTPQRVFQYRSRQGGLAILQSQHFQATNARHISGAEEIVNAESVVVDQAGKHSALAKQPMLRRAFLGMPNGFRTHFDGFLTCFSTPGNDPGQWERYGDKGCGMVLEIDSGGIVEASFRDVGSGRLMLFDPVNYEESKLRSHVDYVLSEVSQYYRERRKRTRPRHWPALTLRTARFLASEFSTVIVLCKPKKFEVEKEWRLWESFARSDSGHAQRVRLRNGPHGTQEYIEFRPYAKGVPPLPIKSVRMGPKVADVDAAKKEVRSVLDDVGLADVPVLANDE